MKIPSKSDNDLKLILADSLIYESLKEYRTIPDDVEIHSIGRIYFFIDSNNHI